MQHAVETNQADQGVQKLVPLTPFMAVIAATAAIIFGLGATLSWQVCLVVVLAAIALAVGVVFTVLEMRRLGKPAKFIG
jgi:Flp pilus assembly protein TadB